MTEHAEGGILGVVVSTVPSRRERKKSATHEALLDSALALFAEKGFANTTIEDIAERADVAPRTFFRYFPNKVAVLQSATDEHLDRLRSLLAASPPGEPPLVSLMRALKATAIDLQESRDRILLQKQISIDARLDHGVDEFWNLWTRFEAILAEHLGVEVDADPAPALFTGIAIGLASGSVRAWLAQGAEGELAPFFEAGFAMLRSAVDQAGS